MTHQTVQINSEQQCYEMFSEPIHYPLTIGNETFVISLQDQRQIVDRRNWFLSRIESSRLPQYQSQNADKAPSQHPLPVDMQALFVRLLQELQASVALQFAPLLAQNVNPNQKESYCFHYPKQTDTDDLPYYQHRDRLSQEGRVVKHVHYYVECANKHKATNTEDSGQHMDCDPITDEEDLAGKMSRRRCVACHIQEPGMIAIYQHPRGVDRIWTYVTGIIVKSKDQLCIPCYDELRVAHRFKEKCIHNNINRLGLLPRRPPFSHVQHEPPTSDDSIPAEPSPSVQTQDHRMPGEECLLVQPQASSEQQQPTGARMDFYIKAEPAPQEENHREDVHRPPPEEHIPLPVETGGEQHQIGHEVPPIDVVKMELELSLTDIGLRDDAYGCSTDDDGEREDDGNEVNGEMAFNNPDAGAQHPCDQCVQTFLSRAALKQHQQKEHKKSRRDITNAVKYRRVLSGKINELMCRYCYREFGEPGAKAAHEMTHLNDPKPFQCSYADCNRLFQHRSALNRHFYTHVMPKRFKCSVCPKRFHQHSSMVVHERQHRGDRPYICPQCGKGFTHVSNVKRHIRFHNGEKPYQCGKCPARFTTSTDLRRHMNSRRCMIGSIKAAM
uniref:C2H2-type domain-containing protein n=1 Tax=Anopheles atroparvus TaxID=41427 RepID=A0A182JJG5_ANOAO